MIYEKNNSSNNNHHHHHRRHKIMIVIIVIVICSRIGSEHCIAQQITSSTFLSFYPNCEEKGCLGEKTTVLKIVVASCALLF